jgi:hypothetical protein
MHINLYFRASRIVEFSLKNNYLFQSEQNDVPGPLHPEYSSHPEGKKISFIFLYAFTDKNKYSVEYFPCRYGYWDWINDILSPV